MHRYCFINEGDAYGREALRVLKSCGSGVSTAQLQDLEPTFDSRPYSRVSVWLWSFSHQVSQQIKGGMKKKNPLCTNELKSKMENNIWIMLPVLF